MSIAQNTYETQAIPNSLHGLAMVYDYDADDTMPERDSVWQVEYKTDDGDYRFGLMTRWGKSPYWTEEAQGIQRAYIVADDGSWTDYALLENVELIAKVIENDVLLSEPQKKTLYVVPRAIAPRKPLHTAWRNVMQVSAVRYLECSTDMELAR
jgi:hypothetical protein